jgi:hypothetical protein
MKTRLCDVGHVEGLGIDVAVYFEGEELAELGSVDVCGG